MIKILYLIEIWYIIEILGLVQFSCSYFAYWIRHAIIVLLLWYQQSWITSVSWCLLNFTKIMSIKKRQLFEFKMLCNKSWHMHEHIMSSHYFKDFMSHKLNYGIKPIEWIPFESDLLVALWSLWNSIENLYRHYIIIYLLFVVLYLVKANLLKFANII